MDKKGQLNHYAAFLVLIVFWTFLIMFSSIFQESLLYGNLNEGFAYDLDNPIVFYTRLATFTYPQISPIASIVFDCLIAFTLFVGFLVIYPAKSS